MPRIKTGEGKVTRTWQQTIIDRVRAGKVVPLISNIISNDMVLAGNDQLVDAYAAYIKYPLAKTSQLAQLAQFFSVTDETATDPRAVKEDYVNFIKNRLYDIAEAEGTSEDTLAELEEEFDDVNFSEFSERLGYPHFEREPLEPLLILAELPLPIYLTTSYHNFIEVALKRAGKEPRTDICRWHKGLEGIPSVFESDYQPTREEPLVYHLHGLDTHPGSLVLTEDDHMEFLVAVSQNVGRGTDPIPLRIRQAMADSSLVMLGYNIYCWDFKVLFWGLIKPRPLHQTSVSIQLIPDEVERNYFKKYLDEYEFRIYWGDIYGYTRELRQVLAE